MIEQSITYALLINWLFMLPAYQRFTSGSRRVVNPYYKHNPFRDEAVPLSELVYTAKIRRQWDRVEPYQYVPNWFNRKPFTCPYCMAFWAAFVGVLFIPFTPWTYPGTFAPLANFAIPCMSAAICSALHRWFNSLPVKL